MTDKERTSQLTVLLKASLLDRIEALARQQGSNRTAVVRQALDAGLPTLEQR